MPIATIKLQTLDTLGRVVLFKLPYAKDIVHFSAGNEFNLIGVSGEVIEVREPDCIMVKFSNVYHGMSIGQGIEYASTP